MNAETTTPTAISTPDLDATTAAAADHLAPPFWGWATYRSPTPPGFWSAQNFAPGDGSIVNQLGRQGATHPGLKITAYRRGGIDFGARSILVARVEPVSLTAVGYRVDQFAYLQIGGYSTRARLQPDRAVYLVLASSGKQTVTVGCHQLLSYNAQYGEIICRVSSLSKHRLFGAEEESQARGAFAAEGDDELAALFARAQEEAITEDIGFEEASVH